MDNSSTQPFSWPVRPQLDYAAELNPQQLAAVTAPPGPALVIAGAGAGKTRTLTYRVAFLLEQGLPPESILLLTFTNKAAREMMRRVADLVPQEVTSLWGGTFHSVGHRILRLHAERVGYRPDFTILDREDARHLLADCLDELGLDRKAEGSPKADEVTDLLSFAASTRQPLGSVVDRHFQRLAGQVERLESVQRLYADRKRGTGLMDFDDLLVLWLRLLEEHDDLREHYQLQFRFILVDEYQDTNQIQSDLVELLAARRHNIMAVGDDSQSIYSWRGANFLNIFDFPHRHPGARVYKIQTNYRSTPEILALANAAIAPNVRQHRKELSAVARRGPKPAQVVCRDAGIQAAFVARRILELHEEGISLRDIAVLYRSHFHALELQLELTRRRIPFSLTSGIRFFEQSHIKDTAAPLRLLCNRRDELAFKRLVMMAPGIGEKASAKLWQQFSPPLEHAATASLTESFNQLSASIPRKAAAFWVQLAATIAQLEAEHSSREPARLVPLWQEAVYREYLKDNYANCRSRLEDLERLTAFSARFASLEEFLGELALLTNVEAESDDTARTDEERLRLSTVHQAKGLEWSVVFVIMLCEEMFPARLSVQDAEGEEEERRLFYVALTRAKRELYLCRTVTGTARDGDANIRLEPSRFIKDIPRELFEEWDYLFYRA